MDADMKCEQCGSTSPRASSDDVAMLRREIGLDVYAGASFCVGTPATGYQRVCPRCYLKALRAPSLST